MNMNGVYAQDAKLNQKVSRQAAQSSPPSEFKVGQELEGIILKVSDQISINFSGREVKASPSTIPDAREGEIRKFQITEISNKGIVLKEVGSTDKLKDSPGVNGIVFTQTEVDASAVLTTEDKEDEETKDQLNEISSKMTATNCEDLQSEGISLESYKLELLAKALARIKVQRNLKSEHIKDQSEKLKQEVEQARQLAMGFLPDHAATQNIADSLVKADLPVTKENVLRIANAMKLSSVVGQMNQASAAYLIKNELEPSIEHIYKAVHSGETNPLINSEVEFNQIKEFVDQMITEAEFEDANAAMKEAKWLFQSNLNLTKENIQYKMDLEKLPENLTLDFVAQGAAQCLAKGQKAEECILLLQSKIKIGETRLKLSYEAQGKMLNKGIEVDTDGMQEQIDNLKQLEQEYYKSYLGEATQGLSDKVDIIEQSVAALNHLKQSSVHVLGQTFEQRHEIKLVQLSEVAIGNTDKYQQAEKSYEALMTTPRKDMGDSIQKAFINVDSQLDLLGLEKTNANQRAIRILAYNQIELTTEHITAMKAYDAKVNHLLANMTPTVTAAMVKDKINPLNVPIDELYQITKEYQEQLGEPLAVKYSEYLVDLERNGAITKEQRDAYIGIYRLLHQVEASDGAAVGAVVKAGKEMTLNSLLTQVRTSNRGSMNLIVNDEQGTVEQKVGYTNSITDAINGYYHEMSDYQQTVVSSMLQKLDGNALSQVAQTYGDKLYDLSLEQLQQELSEITTTTQRNQSERMLAKIQETSKQPNNHHTFLEDYHLTDSLQNRTAAKNMIEFNSKLYDKTEKELKDKDSLRQYAKEILQGIGDSQEFNKSYDAMQQSVINQLKEEVFAVNEQEVTSTIVNDINAICDMFSLNQQLQTKEFYNIPLELKDSLVNVNLTVVHNTKEKGKIRISIPTDQFGTISVQAFVERGQVKCLITSDVITALPTLKNKADDLVSSIQELGYSLTQQHYSYETHSQEQFIYASGNIYKEAIKQQEKRNDASPQDTKTDTAGLYQIAKQLITHLSAMA